MAELKIKKTNPSAILPNYANPGDAGMDLYSSEDLILRQNERHAVKTGIKMEIPEGFVGLIWDKSGIAANKGIKTMAGVIDSGYRGEVAVVLHNLSKEDFKIEKNMKIAQMLIQPIHKPNLVEVDELSSTQRGEKGFGSSGK